MKMATWAEINGKISTNGSPLTKCPTGGEVLAAGSHINIKNYSPNRLVALDDVTRLTENVISFRMWSSSTVQWSSAYPLTSRITARITYVDFNIQTRDYAFLMSAGKSGDREELPGPMRELKEATIDISKDSTYYYTVKKY